MGFDVITSDDKTFDAMIVAPEGMSPCEPLVLEVKSGKELSPSRSQLRQLDDWVYELSGEEKFRKRRLGLRFDFEHWITDRIPVEGPTGVSYPTACKGVFIYNCTKGDHFRSKMTGWLEPNEAEFARKRDFCVLTLRGLLDWYNAIKGSRRTVEEFWRAVHETEGALVDPD